MNSTIDPNDLTFQVNVERLSVDNLLKCSFNVSADRKCIANALQKNYLCKIYFAVSSCPQLILQQKQEEDYQIGIFSQNIIGRSSGTTFHVLCKFNFSLLRRLVCRLHVNATEFQKLIIIVSLLSHYPFMHVTYYCLHLQLMLT